MAMTAGTNIHSRSRGQRHLLSLPSFSFRLMRSWLWPVAAYGVMGLWLMMVNAENLGLFAVVKPNYYWILVELDSLAHFTVALSLACVSQAMFGRTKTILWMIGLIIGWEIFEVKSYSTLTGFSLEGMHWPYYMTDTAQDMAMGLFGVLIGVSMTEEP